MKLFNKKDIKEKEIVKGKKSKDKQLSKYLPSLLFVSTQKDINEKALKSYIFSLAKSSFPTINSVKYSIKKISKNEYLYEIHDGSSKLTYLPLVYNKFITEGETEIVLKTSNQNIKVVRKPNGKIDSSLLVSTKNRDDEAIIDYDSSGKLKDLIKPGTASFIISSIFFAITGVIAGASYVSKYYMLNEDYSYNPEIADIEDPSFFFNSIDTKFHSKYKYINSIRYDRNKWRVDYKEIEKPKEDIEVEEVVDIEVEGVNITPDVSVYERGNSPHKELNTINQKNVETKLEKNIDERNHQHIENDIKKRIEENIKNNTKKIKEDINENIDMVIEPNISEQSTELNIELENVISSSDVDTDIEILPNDIKGNTDEKEMVMDIEIEKSIEEEIIEDEFEIIDEGNMDLLDLSVLPENIVIEIEGESK